MKPVDCSGNRELASRTTLSSCQSPASGVCPRIAITRPLGSATMKMAS